MVTVKGRTPSVEVFGWTPWGSQGKHHDPHHTHEETVPCKDSVAPPSGRGRSKGRASQSMVHFPSSLHPAPNLSVQRPPPGQPEFYTQL